jgi:hypothetical protein
MAVQGTPLGGLDDIAALAYVSGALTLVAYINAANSLGPSTVTADLVQPTTVNGYAPVLLDGTWSSTGGVITYIHSTPTNPGWIATGAWSSVVRGVAIVRGSLCRHFKDISPFTAAAGKKLTIDLSTVTG